MFYLPLPYIAAYTSTGNKVVRAIFDFHPKRTSPP